MNVVIAKVREVLGIPARREIVTIDTEQLGQALVLSHHYLHQVLLGEREPESHGSEEGEGQSVITADVSGARD